MPVIFDQMGLNEAMRSSQGSIGHLMHTIFVTAPILNRRQLYCWTRGGKMPKCGAADVASCLLPSAEVRYYVMFCV